MSSAADLLERAAIVARGMQVSDRTDVLLGQLALLCIHIMRTSPDDQAEAAQLIVRQMKR